MWLFETKEGIAVFVICIVVALALSVFLSCLFVARFLVILQLKRTKKSKWGRQCSQQETVQLKMYNDGVAWSELDKFF